jgi:predicted glycosyltransferase
VSRSVLLHVQYLLGIGHLQRTLRIAGALARDGITVTLVNGGPPAAELAADPKVRGVQLEPVRARDASFALVDDAGRPIGDTLRGRRQEALLATFAAARPDAVVIEGFPFARRAFAFELDPLIAAAQAATPRPRVICSVRDIIAWRDDPARHRTIAERVCRDFDAVLVHGDPKLIPFEASFPAAPDIADRLIYTGYVYEAEDAPSAHAPAPTLPRKRGRENLGPAGEDHRGAEVVVSAGGGAAGAALLNAVVAARRDGCLADAPWRLLTGANLPEAEYAALCRSAPAGVTVERFRPDLPALLRQCRVSVSQAGYNTVLDILLARARAVLVPFAAERETEQLMRAERLAALGAVELVRESDLSPGTLAAAIERAATRQPPSVMVNTDGAANSARIIAALIDGCPVGYLAAKTGKAMIGR